MTGYFSSFTALAFVTIQKVFLSDEDAFIYSFIVREYLKHALAYST